MRTTFTLTSAEWSDFDKLRPVQGEALAFWRKVAHARNLDPQSILSSDGTSRGKFSGLTWGHKYHWCWPSPLICQQKPQDVK